MALEPLAHVYDLALRALAEQERQVTELRNRLAPVLAAAGLGATVLMPAAFRGRHPLGFVETIGAALGIAGIAATVLAATYLLFPRPLTFGLDASGARAFLRRQSPSDSHGYYMSMTVGLDQCRRRNLPVIWRLHIAFTAMLCGMTVELCGLAAAAAVA